MRPADQCPGNRRWIQLMFDAIPADADRAVDARRARRVPRRRPDALRRRRTRPSSGSPSPGAASASARSSTNAPRTRTTPIRSPTSQSPHQLEATVTFRAVGSNEGNARREGADLRRPLRGARLADRRHRSARRPHRGPNNLDNAATFVAGHVRVRRPGERATATSASAGRSPAGASQTVTINMPTNWASTSQGRDGGRRRRRRTAHLIDDTEGTNWDEPAGGPAVNVASSRR